MLRNKRTRRPLAAPETVAGGFLFFALLIVACSPSPAPSPRLSFPWLQHADWRGKAEIAVYRGQVRRYGHFRAAELTTITVTEPWNSAQMVKAERGDSGVYALKQNQALTFQTGVYPYRQMNSVFWKVRGGAFLKATMSSQEWCGQSFKELRADGDDLRFSFNSYWEDEADGVRRISRPAAGARRLTLLYDELPLAVRTAEFEKVDSLHLFPLLMSSQVDRPDFDIGEPRRAPQFSEASVERQKVSLNLGARTYPSTMRYEVRSQGPSGERVDRFYVDLENPSRTLLKWERHDGGEFTLSALFFEPYWQQNGPGDALRTNRLDVHRNH